jgi:hypothetical protein
MMIPVWAPEARIAGERIAMTLTGGGRWTFDIPLASPGARKLRAGSSPARAPIITSHFPDSR